MLAASSHGHAPISLALDSGSGMYYSSQHHIFCSPVVTNELDQMLLNNIYAQLLSICIPGAKDQV